MRDMEFKNLREFAREAHKTVWRTPGVLLGQMADYKRANAEAALYMWALQVIAPRLVHFQQVIDRDLLSEFSGEYGECWMEHHDPVADDVARAATIMSKAYEDSAVMVNEYRDSLGLEPLEDGDVFRVPTGPGTYQFVKSLADAAPSAAPAVAPAASARPALPPASAPAAPSQEVAGAQDGQAQKQRTASPFRSMERRELGEYLLRSLVEHTEPLEEPFKRTLRTLFEEQEAALHTRFEQHLRIYAGIRRDGGRDGFGDDGPDDSDDSDAFSGQHRHDDEIDQILGHRDDFVALWAPRFSDASRRNLEDAVEAGGSHALKVVGARFGFNLHNPATAQLLLERRQRFARKINETTWSDLKQSLVEGMTKGETLREMQVRIADVMDIAKGFRTQNIARTEIVGLYNAGAMQGYRQASVSGKSWLTAGDDRVRDAHYDLGEKYTAAHPIGIDEPFRYGGLEADCPGAWGDPGMDCQCRCTVLPETLKDNGGDGKERHFILGTYDPDEPRNPNGEWGSGGGDKNGPGQQFRKSVADRIRSESPKPGSWKEVAGKPHAIEYGDRHIIEAGAEGAYNVCRDDTYTRAMLSGKTSLIYHMYVDYPEHGAELAARFKEADPPHEFDLVSRASTVMWADGWAISPSAEFSTTPNGKIARTVDYGMVFRPATRQQAERMLDIIDRDFTLRSGKGHSGVAHSWETPDVRLTGFEDVNGAKEVTVNTAAKGRLSTLSKERIDRTKVPTGAGSVQPDRYVVKSEGRILVNAQLEKFIT